MQTLLKHSISRVHLYVKRDFLTCFQPSDTSGSEFQRICNETLESLNDYIDSLVANDNRNFDVMYASGVITANFEPIIGTYIINRQLPNRQIWLSSPFSGPIRYDLIYIKNYQDVFQFSWVYRHDGNTLHNLLQSEFRSIFKNQIVDFSQCAHSLCQSNVQQEK